MKTTVQHQPYVAKVGVDAAKRLALQHQIFAPGSAKLLKSAGIQPGMHVLEIGAGCGDETIMLAELVGPTGLVVAVDISQLQIDTATANVAKKGLTNVKFYCSSVYDIDKIPETFDLAFCRFLLGHLTDPLLALKKMFTKLKMGGVLVCDEATVSLCATNPYSSAYAKNIQCLMSYSKKLGLDFDIGTKLNDLFHQVGCKDITVSYWQPIVTLREQKLSALWSAIECGPRYIEAGIAREDEVKEIVNGIEDEVVNKEEVMMAQCRMTHIYGTKPTKGKE